MPRKESAGPVSAQAQQDAVSEGIENFELPRSLVTKIAKSAIPENTKLQKDTVLSLVKGSTVFINYLAATAHDVSTSKQHKSISASDVLKALELIEFADLVGPLQTELQIYRDNAKGKRSSHAPAASAPVPAGAVSAPPGAGPARSKTATARAKGKERAVEDAVSAPLPLIMTNGVHHAPNVDVDEEMRDVIPGDETEGDGELEGEPEDDEEVEDDVEDEPDEGDIEEDEEVGDEPNGLGGDVEMGGLPEDDAVEDKVEDE